MPAPALFAPALFAFLLAAPHQTDDFSKTWDEVSRGIEARYYARETRKPEMDRLLAKYRPIASSAHNRQEFGKAVNDMIAEFKDSHFAFYSDDQQGYYVMDALVRKDNAAKLPNIGAYFKGAADGYTVQMVLNGSAAEKADLRKGDLVETADGTPFNPVASLSRDGDVRLSIVRDGQRLQKDVHPSRDTATDMFLDATRESQHVISENGRKIGYIHLWTLASDAFKTALSSAVYGPLSKTDAMILDLRDGFGGRPEGYADPFFRPEVNLDWVTPTGTLHQLFGYQRALVVLINGGSRSAKEVLSQILKKSRRATLVGSKTAGNVLGTWPQRVNDWAYIEIPSVDVVSDGVRLEGRGVEPDGKLDERLIETHRARHIGGFMDASQAEGCGSRR